MYKKRLLLLIILASISIISLIAIQIYWLQKNIETQRKQFDQTVMEVMNHVVVKLEREEAITKVTSSLLKSEDLFEDFETDPTLLINKNNSSGNLNGEESINNPTLVKTPSDQLRLEFTPPPTTDSSFFIIRQTQKRILSSSINDPSPSDTGFVDRLRKNKTLLNDIVNELALISISRNNSESVSFEKIDSLFAYELKKSGIEEEFVFDILDVETNQLTFSENKTETSQLRDTPYKLNLFTNSYLIESDYLLLYFPDQSSYFIENSGKILIISFVLVCILIVLFYSSISTIYKQKKLSKVKNDFINNMTHELKTPISTISLACEALADSNLKLDQERQTTYVNMIQDENKRLSVLVDNVLKSAVWDSSELKLNFNTFSLHSLILKVAKSFEIQIIKREGELKLDLTAEDDIIQADQVHISNVIFNLLDNANKYSPQNPKIRIKTFKEENFIVFSISDNGIGISKENQSKIFDKFYRVSTGNIHDVKGFGLGLSYVKRIIELHQGEIHIESSKESGTTINIKLIIDGHQ